MQNIAEMLCYMSAADVIFGAHRREITYLLCEYRMESLFAATPKDKLNLHETSSRDLLSVAYVGLWLYLAGVA